MNRQNATTTQGEIASKNRPDVTIVSDQQTYTFAEVPSGKDVRTVRDFARLITRNLKDLRKLGNKSEGLYIIWKD